MSFSGFMVLATLVGFQGGGAGADLSDAELDRSVARLIAIPEAGKVSEIGTGFVIGVKGPHKYIMTSAHVVNEAVGVRVDFTRGQKRHAVRVWVDLEHDLAVVELNTEAPADAVTLRRYAGPDLTEETGSDLRVVGYLLGSPSSTLRGAKFENRMNAGQVRADGKFLNSETIIYQLHVDFTRGGSGSPVVDRAGRVVGVYHGGPMHGALSLNFCVPFRYMDVREVTRGQPAEMTVVGAKVDQMADLALSGLVSETQGMPLGVPPSSLVIKRVPRENMFKDFFEDKKNPHNEEVRKSVDAILDNGKKHVNHVVNTRVGLGFLVPEGFELSEVFDDDSKAYTLTVRRPGSHYAVRYYSKPMISLKKDVASERENFNLETLAFLAGVLKVQITPPGTPPTQPGQAAIAPLPLSWPAVYRDSYADDLVSLRSYVENGRALMHSYQIELCRRTNRAEISGFSAPITAFAKQQLPEEVLELLFILNSTYDTELGREISKRLRSDPLRKLTKAFGLPTPGALPEGTEIGNQVPITPLPGDNGVIAAGWGEPQAPPQGRLANPADAGLAAANLGITYNLVQLPWGGFGARLNHMPSPDSPAAQVLLGPNMPGFLETGDTILGLDGVPVTGPNSLLMHYGPTWIDFIDVRTGQRRLGFTVLPTPLPRP